MCFRTQDAPRALRMEPPLQPGIQEPLLSSSGLKQLLLALERLHPNPIWTAAWKATLQTFDVASYTDGIEKERLNREMKKNNGPGTMAERPTDMDRQTWP